VTSFGKEIPMFQRNLSTKLQSITPH